MKIPLYILGMASCLLSCGSSDGDQKEKATTQKTAGPKVVKSDKNVTDTVAKQMMEMFGMEGETFHDMMKTDSLEGEIMKVFSPEGLATLLKESNLSEAEQQQLIEKMAQGEEKDNPSGDQNLQGRTSQSMDKYFKELETALAASGSEQQLKDLQAMMKRENVSERIDALSTESKDPQIQNIRKVLETREPSLIEEQLTSFSLYGNAKRKETMRALAFASESEGIRIIAKHYEVPEKEIEFLKLLPSFPPLTTSMAAEEMRDYKLPAEINSYLEGGKASSNFKTLTTNFLRDNQLESNPYIKRAETARNEFYTLNPGWYGEKGTTGNTYSDARNKLIYLPLGDISFADRVIRHDLGNPEGSNSAGSLGVPNMVGQVFGQADRRTCNLGERGVLTLEFTDNAISDVNGPDLYVFEIGEIEPTNLEISKDGQNWVNVGRISGGTAKVDIASKVKKGETFTYVRLTDLASASMLPGADVDAVAAIGGAMRLSIDSAVLFDTGKYKLKEAASGELEKLLAAIQNVPKATIVVEGHTDNIGNPQSNSVLSQNRAKEVSGYLKEHLKGPYGFETKGYGESQPIAPNDNDDNRQKNRRVEILVIPTS